MATDQSASLPTYLNSFVEDDGLDDIRYLLTLETCKRVRDDETNIRRQLEDKVRLYKSHMDEYLCWYAKYVRLMKLCEIRKALNQKYPLDNELVETTKANIIRITDKITTGALSDHLSPEKIEICKQNLSKVKSSENLSKLQKEIAEIKAAVLKIQTVMETVEANVEKAVVQGLDYFVAELQMEIQKE